MLLEAWLALVAAVAAAVLLGITAWSLLWGERRHVSLVGIVWRVVVWHWHIWHATGRARCSIGCLSVLLRIDQISYMFKNANEQLALTPDQRQILLVLVALLNAQNGITHVHNLAPTWIPLTPEASSWVEVIGLKTMIRLD